MRGTLRFFRATTVAAMLAWAACCSAGHYMLSTKNSAGQPKNPSGGLVHFSGGQFLAYASGASGYGGEHEDWSYVECEGEITTLFEWVRDKIPNPNQSVGGVIDDPLDDPPAEVISAEYCIASFSTFTFEPTGGSFCNNGLGFDSEITNEVVYWYDGEGNAYINGYQASGVSEGTLYTKRAGGQTIELKRTPLAYAVGNGLIQASVWYTPTILNPKVSPAGTTRFYDPRAEKFLTGQQIQASVTGDSGGLTVSKYRWSLDGAAVMEFKNYVYSGTGTFDIGKKYPLTDAEKTAARFDFYTVDKGATKVVCDLTYKLPVENPEKYKWAGGLPDFTVRSWSIESVRPTLAGWDVDDGLVTLQQQVNFFHFGPGPGNAPANGQQWRNVAFSIPAPFPQVGQGCFVQLINADRHIYRNPIPTSYPSHYIKQYFNAVEAVDMGFPYPYGQVWSLPDTGSGYDSPRQLLTLQTNGGGNNWYKSTAKDSFKTWAMYKPPSSGPPTTWIPIAMYEWKWNGTAERPPPYLAPWSLTASGGGASSVPNDWLFHPEWIGVSPSPIFYKPF